MDQTCFKRKSKGRSGLVRKVLHGMSSVFTRRVYPCIALVFAGLSLSALLSAQEAEAFKP